MTDHVSINAVLLIKIMRIACPVCAIAIITGGVFCYIFGGDLRILTSAICFICSGIFVWLTLLHWIVFDIENS